jgi:regulator of protease activity HflC (stomatin/prohibitin superfamily)
MSRYFKGQEGKGALSVLVFLVCLSAVILVVLALVLGYVVPPGQIGVRQIAFWPYQGFWDQGLKPGLHWNIPFYSKIYFVPQTLNVVNFDRESENTENIRPLEVPTADRATILVDVSLLTHFYDAPGQENGSTHGGPAELLKTVGVSPDRWENRIRRVAEDSLRKALSELSAAQFYDPKLREEKIRIAHRNMNTSLMPLGIKVDAILLRRYTYEEGIENAIFQKNLQELEKMLAERQAEYEKAESEVREAEAQGDAKIKTIKLEGENRALVLRSEGDLYEAEKRASGDLAVAKAKAEVDKLKAQALAQSSGAQLYVARELAPLLGSLKGGVVTGLDPYDLEAWLKRFGVEEGKGKHE